MNTHDTHLNDPIFWKKEEKPCANFSAPKKLKSVIKKNGFEYRLITRSEVAAIYEQFHGYNSWGYEVFKIRRHNGYQLGGKEIPPSECFPSNEEFGLTAWSVNSLKRAKEIKKEIEQGVR